MSYSSLAKLVTSYKNFYGPPNSSTTGPIKPTSKRRREEVLGLDTEMGVYNKMFKPYMWRPEKKRARQSYMSQEMKDAELSMPYFKRGKPYQDQRHLSSLSKLSIPAFSGDHMDEFGGKLDLILNNITSLYGARSPLEPFRLMFHYTGLIKSNIGPGRDYMDDVRSVIERSVYEDDVDGNQANRERDVITRSEVHNAFRVHLADETVDPVVTMVPFSLLQTHIIDSNGILKSQYADLMKGLSLSELKARVVNQHGPDSVVSLMVQLNSPEDFYNTFNPRGILASKCTGRTTPFSNGTPYQGLVTLQTAGTLHIDTEDGDDDLYEGDILDTATLYLVVEMKELVPNDNKFNYPWIRMLLTPKTIDQVESDIVMCQGGTCVKSRDGKNTKTIIKPIAQLRGSSYYASGSTSQYTKQLRDFSIIMNYRSSDLKKICFQM